LRNFADIVKKVLTCWDGLVIGNLVDARLQGQFNLEQATTMLHIAVTCLEEEINQRPIMDEVVKELIVLAERDEYFSNSL
jgi:hypothetical protein